MDDHQAAEYNCHSKWRDTSSPQSSSGGSNTCTDCNPGPRCQFCHVASCVWRTRYIIFVRNRNSDNTAHQVQVKERNQVSHHTYSLCSKLLDRVDIHHFRSTVHLRRRPLNDILGSLSVCRSSQWHSSLDDRAKVT